MNLFEAKKVLLKSYFLQYTLIIFLKNYTPVQFRTRKRNHFKVQNIVTVIDKNNSRKLRSVINSEPN